MHSLAASSWARDVIYRHYQSRRRVCAELEKCISGQCVTNDPRYFVCARTRALLPASDETGCLGKFQSISPSFESHVSRRKHNGRLVPCGRSRPRRFACRADSGEGNRVEERHEVEGEQKGRAHVQTGEGDARLTGDGKDGGGTSESSHSPAVRVATDGSAKPEESAEDRKNASLSVAAPADKPSNSSSEQRTEAPTPTSTPFNISPIQFSFSIGDLLGPEKVDGDDVKLFRERLCGYSTFFVTGQEPFGDAGEGVLLTGNMRGIKEHVYTYLRKGMEGLFGQKYELFMIEEPQRMDLDMDDGSRTGGPRVSFVLVRRDTVNAPPESLWQYVIALVLVAVTAGACLELGLATQISKIPPEVLRYFTAPTAEAQGEPPSVEVLAPFMRDALPTAYGVFGVQVFHELGHWLTARRRSVQLGLPFVIPNITIGSFGSITPFRSPCPDRSAKFDVSVAGPVAGAALSAAMFAAGLALTAAATSDPSVGGALAGFPGLSEDLVRVPSLLFQGSLLLGLLSRFSLGYDTLHAATVAIHPLLITGWCGLTVSALNLLPVGSLDGGRAMQAAFGRSALNWASTATYISLGLGLIGGTLSLPFGLYVLILQRVPEKPALNDVTEVSGWRKGVLGVLLLLALLVLLPLWDGLAQDTGIGLTTDAVGMDFF